ncbi:NAD(P)/FAD-dependent oxidoreductase [Deinococcus maricopensis]|uniref:FAD-dependent pyridine nucleotide-disulfide oxidoreductase n=1 Tax=Deinococcus maricopensis (strain DSM 21211 / LMG 22137 / NRRL B-23946 / LB-34) TaxID=709986 RepID=E8U972_DEIML|nr:NAD(P)/FAD-dependent oxidoreductase [Deinococcus maricopensis]ADV67611.1 FAD-dependent pyridine nucleotide-disulfide oxidoreductase [Deinococcus maricopensis DSM 21211]
MSLPLPDALPPCDVAVIGAGPSGLNAALVLGRARRDTLLLDGGPPRNAPTRAAHGVFTRDGAAPLDLKREALAQLQPYPVTHLEVQVADVQPEGDAFRVFLEDGQDVLATKVLFATGVRDLLPDIPGLRERWGRSVYHCPYCDGWELRGQAVGVLGTDDATHHLALSLTSWTREVTIFTDGPSQFTDEQRLDFERLGLNVVEAPLRRLEGDGENLACAYTDDGAFAITALLLSPKQEQASALPARLGCDLNDKGRVLTDDVTGETSVPGVYAVGDMTGAPQYVMSAAASGMTVAVAVNTRLIHDARLREGARFHKGARVPEQEDTVERQHESTTGEPDA